MAIYHLTARAVCRSKGHSAVAAAAYRAGERLLDERRGCRHDYRRRHGVLAAEILAPDGAPAWMRMRESLWNSVELIEKRKDACVARELEVALPRELDRDAHRRLVRGFVAEQLTARGVVADIAWHSCRARDGGENVHAHILFTTRPLLKNRTGFGKKDRGLEHKATLRQFREAWRDHVNRWLEEAGDEPASTTAHCTNRASTGCPSISAAPPSRWSKTASRPTKATAGATPATRTKPGATSSHAWRRPSPARPRSWNC